MHEIQERLLRLSKVVDLSKFSYREIGRRITSPDEKLIHPQRVKFHLGQLIDKGLIKSAGVVTDRNPRSSSHIESIPTIVSIPIVGSANAGPATKFAEQEPQGYVKMSASLLPARNYKKLYALQIEGKSMNQAVVAGKKIESGDYVIVDSEAIAPNSGDYVVVTYDGVANVKKIYLDRESEQVVLFSESSEKFEPIYINPHDNWDGLISGRVIQVAKSPKL